MEVTFKSNDAQLWNEVGKERDEVGQEKGIMLMKDRGWGKKKIGDGVEMIWDVVGEK